MKYRCPYCYKSMPDSYEMAMWECCKEIGNAEPIPSCPKCGAEFMDTFHEPCAVCGFGGMSRDNEWTMAIVDALGSNSGFKVPLVPSADAFRDLFAAIRQAAYSQPSRTL